MEQNVSTANMEQAPAAVTVASTQNKEHVVGVLPVFVVLTLLLVITSLAIGYKQNAILACVTVSCGLWLLLTRLVLRGLQSHPFTMFGAANAVTSLRAAITCLITGLIPVASNFHTAGSDTWMWLATWLALAVLILDGVDGHLARKSGLQSAFGARFDMETDALLALVIVLLLWQSQKMAIWVLGLGLMRYAFIIASYKIIALQNELYPSLRRKTVCVLQISALCALLCPLVKTPYTTLIGGVAMFCLASSFIRDILWLLKPHSD